MIHDLVLTNQTVLPDGFLLLAADNETLVLSDFLTPGMENKSGVTESRLTSDKLLPLIVFLIVCRIMFLVVNFFAYTFCKLKNSEEK